MMINSYLFQKNIYPLSLIVILFALASCENKTEYEQLVESELEKEVRHDSLFLGYKFGMNSKQFFDHSWKLNQEQIITGSSQIEYELTELSSPARMVFFPEFHDERIYRMPVEISFKSWAPWNRELSSDSLITELVDLYSDIYGRGFIKTIHPELGEKAWIKIDSNRRISIYRKDEMTARIEFLDLSVKRKKQKARR